MSGFRKISLLLIGCHVFGQSPYPMPNSITSDAELMEALGLTQTELDQRKQMIVKFAQDYNITRGGEWGDVEIKDADGNLVKMYGCVKDGELYVPTDEEMREIIYSHVLEMRGMKRGLYNIGGLFSGGLWQEDVLTGVRAKWNNLPEEKRLMITDTHIKKELAKTALSDFNIVLSEPQQEHLLTMWKFRNAINKLSPEDRIKLLQSAGEFGLKLREETLKSNNGRLTNTPMSPAQQEILNAWKSSVGVQKQPIAPRYGITATPTVN